MVYINDIYSRMDSMIVSQGFWETEDVETKKFIIDRELKNYLISKIQEVSGTNAITDGSKTNFSVTDLLKTLVTFIPQEQRGESVEQFSHYIISVSSVLQGYSVVWMEEDEEKLINFPLIQFDENGLWTSLLTNKKTDHVKTFAFVYDVFNNHFMKENAQKKLEMRSFNNER